MAQAQAVDRAAAVRGRDRMRAFRGPFRDGDRARARRGRLRRWSILLITLCHTAACADPPAVLPSKASPDVRGSIDVITREVEQIRSLPFKRRVRTDVQSMPEFRASVSKELRRQFGPGGADAYVRALARLGVLERPVNVETVVLDLLESQAAAHYDPEDKTYYLLATNVPPLARDLIASHELCHALQDQHFDLRAFCQEDVEAIRDNADAGSARQALVEGGATLVMTTWLIGRQMNLKQPAAAAAFASTAVSLQAAMGVDEILELARAGASDPSLGGMNWAVEGLEKCPRFFVEQLLYCYLQGAFMVDFVRTRGGWQAVDRLYARPPESTEQVLHPEKLLGDRDAPVDVRLPRLLDRLPPGWSLCEQDVLGELGVRALLRTAHGRVAGAGALAVDAAEGWGGDRYYYFVREAGDEDLLVWQTEWDTLRDATEFVVAYRAGLSNRFPQMQKIASTAQSSSRVSRTWEVEPGRFLKLVRDGRLVGVVDTTHRARLDIMWP